MGLFKKIFKPVSKVLDKIIPNEIKPFLPYAAAAFPMLYSGGLGGTTTFQQMLRRGAMSGALNIGGQLAQEGSEGDINLLSAGLASLAGGLTAPGTPGVEVGGPMNMYGGQPGIPSAAKYFAGKGGETAMGEVFSGLGKASKYMSSPGLSKYSIPAGQGTADVMFAEAKRAEDDAEDAAAADDSSLGYTDAAYRAAIRKSMEAYGAEEEEILAAIEAAGYRSGGRVGMISGGGVKAAWNAMKAMKNKVVKSLSRMTDDVEMQGSSDFATDTGGDFSLSVTAKTKKGKKVLDGLVEEGIVEVDNGMYFISDMNLDEATLGMGEGKLKASGMLEEGSGKFTRFDEGVGEAGFGRGSEYYGYDRVIENLKPKKADGGRVGLEWGGMPSAIQAVEEKETKWITQKPEWETVKQDLNNIFQESGGLQGDGMNAVGAYVKDNNLNYEWLLEGDEIKVKEKENMAEPVNILDSMDGSNTVNINGLELLLNNKAKGGRINKADGGMPSVLPKGVEADYRGGGFIPIGSKERADDVPARLSENEFVMTADAVRAAGGGNVNKGAQRMYNVMNNLEARA